MARKSRKETAAVVVQEADAACRAAIYVRLSVEDTHTHSVSIETQQMIIARYLEQYPEISVYDTYIDNGATGTNFHRPGFQQMLLGFPLQTYKLSLGSIPRRRFTSGRVELRSRLSII